ncbi:MAG: TRAP transporter substrate-binding protein [Deltaproteobacteria bacterium]|jgi:tripartite ATP-independent transporter DctP family solute receptor|nr:TRAP transporter substrate-binding protein [Deltaproteobacteria bacterium]
MKIRTILLVAVLVSILALHLPLAGAAEYTLKFANPVPKDHSWGRAADQFAKMAAEATNGRVEVQVFHAGSLGKIREVLEMAKVGTVDFVLSGTGHVTGHVPELGITVLPYLWKDTDTMFQALDGPFGRYLGEQLEAKGFVVVGWWDNGFRHVSNNKRPVTEVTDMKGLKIRCLPAKVHVEFFKSLGAAPTPMGWTELYQALQQGVVDAQENPPAMVYLGKLYEVQKYYSLTSHVNEPGNVLMSKASLNKLPKELQVAVMVAAQKATIWQRAENQKDNEAVMQKLIDAGLKINDVPDATKAEFRKAAMAVYPDAVKGFGDKGKEMTEIAVFFNN